MSVFSLGFLVWDELKMKPILGGNAGAAAQVSVQSKAGIGTGGRQRQEFSYSFIPLFTTKVPKKSRVFWRAHFAWCPIPPGSVWMGGDFGLSAVQDKRKPATWEDAHISTKYKRTPPFQKTKRWGTHTQTHFDSLYLFHPPRLGAPLLRVSSISSRTELGFISLSANHSLLR